MTTFGWLSVFFQLVNRTHCFCESVMVQCTFTNILVRDCTTVTDEETPFPNMSVHCVPAVFLRAKAATAFSVSQPSQFCPSVTWLDQSKTVQARITKSSPSPAWKTLVSGTVKLFHKFEGGYPERGCNPNREFGICILTQRNSVRQGLGYYQSIIESRTLALDWRQIQLP